MNVFKELDQSILLFKTKIEELKDKFLCLYSYEENQTKFQNGEREMQLNETKETTQQRIRRKENECDKYLEYYMRHKQIVENGITILDLIVNFQTHLSEIIEESQKSKEEYGNKINDILMELIEIEKQKNDNKYSKIIINNYKKMFIKTTKFERMIDEKIQEKKYENRYKMIENYMTENEINDIEKKIERIVCNKIFDSNFDKWEKDISDLYKRIENKSNIIILIETEDEKKFGCYINSKINKVNEYISDSNAFIFKLS